MKKAVLLGVIFIMCNALFAQEKETNDYVEFDDRKNVVHGVYIGLSQQYTKIWGESAGISSFKLAYVANRKLETGVSFNAFFSKQPNHTDLYIGDDVFLYGGYVGLHLEPILFGNRFVSVSFPLLIGGGIAAITERKENGEFDPDDIEDGDNDTFFIIEPGVNIQYNISRFVQIETGIRYRFTESFKLAGFKKDNINGLSVGIGIKVGVFNLGRKKKIKDDF